MLVERIGSLKTITLNAPERSNSLTASDVEELLRVARDSYADDTETLVFRAVGPNFCSGFDLSNLEVASDADLLHRFIRIEMLLQATFMAGFDTIACAKGATYGAGADLFAACRYRLADPSSKFLMPGLQFGVALGTRRFALLVGDTDAYELLAKGVPFEAGHAHRIGFATQVADETQWDVLIQARHESRPVRREALSRLSRLTRRDSYAADMLALVESAAEPGLAGRLRRYREMVQARRKNAGSV